MQKIMMAAMAALMSAGIAQAITVGWTPRNADKTDNLLTSATGYTLRLSSITQTAANETPASGTVTAGMLMPGSYPVSSLGFLITSSSGFNDVQKKTVGLAVAINDTIVAVSNNTRYQFNGGTGNVAWGANAAAGVLAFDMASEFNVNSLDTAFTVYFVNTTSPSTDWVGKSVTDADITSNLYSGTDGKLCSDNNGNLTYRATLPEPTALALLALGVAGMALRRKVR